MIQSGGFHGRLLGPLIKTGLSLIKNVIKPLAKSVLVTLGLTPTASAADAGIHKKILGYGNNTTTLIISNDEMNFCRKRSDNNESRTRSKLSWRRSDSEETKSKRQGRETVRAGCGNKKVRKATAKNKKNF